MDNPRPSLREVLDSESCQEGSLLSLKKAKEFFTKQKKKCLGMKTFKENGSDDPTIVFCGFWVWKPARSTPGAKGGGACTDPQRGGEERGGDNDVVQCSFLLAGGPFHEVLLSFARFFMFFFFFSKA